MNAIMIKCPNTDREVFTGIEIDFVSFNRLPNVLSHSYCSACGRKHLWRTREAWLAPYAAETLSVRVAAPVQDLRARGRRKRDRSIRIGVDRDFSSTRADNPDLIP